MPKITRNFIAGRMNKVVDQRLVPNGEYIDALNIRMGSTENSEVGVIENSKGNLPLTALSYTDGTPLSVDARCIGAIADSKNEKLYWFVHDPSFVSNPYTGKLDLIVSYGTSTNILTYHVISTATGETNYTTTTLNFNPSYLITGIDLIEDLIFFTDDYNPPRFINVKKKYFYPIGYVDNFSSEDLLVIKRPPEESPLVQPIATSSQDNYMDTRFICFAYRYRYSDGEYSATSQWSAPAFVAQPFEFSVDSLLNEGMVNFCNAAIISYNSGGPLVKGIDLLFKQASSNVINIIDRLDKKVLGIGDYSVNTYSFDNSKIYTILPESELLRLYDNVPRFAKAQTIMGNRLMYGNYVDGYDLNDANGQPVKLEYETELISEIIGQSSVPDTTISGDYTIDGTITVPNSVVVINLAGKRLIKGAALSIEVTITHNRFSGPTIPTETTDDVSFNFSFFLSEDYASVYEMATSTQFQDAIGTVFNIQTVFPNLSCTGITFTDAVNCGLPFNLGALTKVGSGISTLGQAIEIITEPGDDTIGLKFLAMKYVDVPGAETTYAFEYYSVVFAEATFQDIATPRSLHSNRGYQIGIVYMDGFLRSSTALVSPYNRDTQYVPCGFSDRKNSIRVYIPPTQIAPSWAARYKFVIKPDMENYETIYCNLFFTDPKSNQAYFLLEGENARKVEQGDRLIVKSDTNGPTQTCVYATVLEKESKGPDFIEPASGSSVPAGVYMKINPNDFAVVEQENATIAPGTRENSRWDGGFTPPSGDLCVNLTYPMNIPDPANPGMFIDYTVPAGSRVKLYFKFQRIGTGDGDRSCEKRIYTLEKTLIVSADYDNMKDWWDGDNVETILNQGIQDIGGNNCEFDNEYVSSFASSRTDIPCGKCTNYYRFYRDSVSNELVLLLSGPEFCPGLWSREKRKSTIFANIEVFRATNLLIFETEPEDALPDVFFENEESFMIIDGQHFGNVQNQNFDTGESAIIDTGFFNCYAFGNGVESYKIRDSIIGRTFNLGNRVTTVANQDYKEANRFADITYSGIYNPESNINKLNEFNLGLLNFKNLETSFGDIYKMDGRDTDVLVLQEDKISYVLSGKNLLSDAAAGGAITSVPEVLGTQIARTEKYGISFNPESYVQWGYDRFFTDAKRGAVIQMRGDSYSNEQLNVISEMNMRTWFRDVFNESFNTQKLGGYDPYMNEYVLSSNNIQLPVNDQCLGCGISQTFTFSSVTGLKQFSFCVDLGPTIGQTAINWAVVTNETGGLFEVSATYDGNTFDSGFINTNGSLNFFKNTNTIETVTILISYQNNLVLDFIADCPIPLVVSIVEVVVTNNSDAGESIHAEYRYKNGSYVSPLKSNPVIFASGTQTPLVSRYNLSSGFQGSSGFPSEGSIMTLQTNKIGSDTFIFDPNQNKFRYKVSQSWYQNNPIEIALLLGSSSIATPIFGGDRNTYYANFNVPAMQNGDYLYLIWDLRESTPIDLCYDTVSRQDVCCDCDECLDGECRTITIKNTQAGIAELLFPEGLCGAGIPYNLTLDPDDSITICIEDQVIQVLQGNVIVSISSCQCTNSTKFLMSINSPSLNVLDNWNNVIFSNGGYTDLVVTTVGQNTLYELFGGSSEFVQPASFWTLDPDIPTTLLEIDDAGGLISVVGGGAFNFCNNLTSVNLPKCTFIGSSAFFSTVENSLTTINIPFCTSLGDTAGDDGVFLPNVNNVITLTVPSILMNALGPGVPDGDIQYLQANAAAITIITV
jgi:hypothetical protein